MTTFVLGGAHSDFARHLQREGRELADLVAELVDRSFEDAKIDARDLARSGTIHVGNAFGELFAGQGHLGAMPATVRPELAGVPAARHEAACASGSVAILAAMAELEAGRYDVALVLGVEQERNVPGDVAAKHLGAAAWVGHEGDGARYLWPHMFARVADAYAERYGLDHAHLEALATQAFANARDNPNAQTRAWVLDGAPNPVVDGRLHRHDCAQVTDGGAAVVLASPRFAEAWAARGGRDLATLPRILGWGHRTVGLPLQPKLDAHVEHELMFPHLAQAVADARRRAARDASQISAYEVHDCFTITGYLAIDHLGLTAPGEAWRAIEAGDTARTGRTPINPGGGLVGIGHPVGATGVRMALDAARRVAARGGAVQTLNLGGSTATVVSLVVGT
nr:acetyl-CoA acetyltransferase [Kofleriaceae bacterium]